MGITEGQLEKRGKYWHWRYRVDGQPTKKSLKVTSHAEAKRLRQAFIAEYNSDPARFTQPAQNPSLEDFWKRYSGWAENHKSPNTLALDKRAWEKLTSFCQAKLVPHHALNC